MTKAQEWADYLAATSKFEHARDTYLNGEYVGENIAMMSGGKARAVEATRMWYCEVDDYKKNPGVFSSNVGHFTQVSALKSTRLRRKKVFRAPLQVVWKSTERVGFGIATGRDGTTRVVANYAPGGNFNFNSPSGAAANVDMADGK